ncbi:polyphosphate--glucose phosphotransferase [Propionimicrobium sp. PCR01-08-3]|uniref:polyphosphate--glucose phosphotransferase n=1 Tax=Propionimicrobium sp. PCR01-08-3 TaxID=3052086 RepID=UPI00255C6084|nr:ROK family protein [Propionimicrobium sp. PCR01-08-3]WIY82799.1 ROK family protein [Propionimicrobium sp. PCR01-08-3]
MTSRSQLVLGIDIGGSGIKGAPVDLTTGEFAAERIRIATPKKATPKACADVVAKIAEKFSDQFGNEPIGIALPAPVVHGTVTMMANLHSSWEGVNAEQLFTERLGRKTVLVNDADAAGLAEVYFGAAKGHPGLVIMTTLGTGIGTALIMNGVLVPNTELGHIEINGHDAETKASAHAKANEHLSYKRWSKRLQKYYRRLEKYFWPDLFVVGGGVSRSHEKFLPLLELSTPIVPATLFNRAGIVGAAIAASDQIPS